MTTYNGWTNYETWNVKLWLDNDEGTYDEVRAMARRSRSAYDLGQELREFVLDGMPDLGASMYADILGAALRDVNWQEIAEAYREDEDAEVEA